MKKICFVTSARSEYGLLKWLMKDLSESTLFDVLLVVTGAHFLREQGYTIDFIRKDGFTINSEIDIKLDTSSDYAIAESMGRLAERSAKAFSRLSPDYIVVLGDRYELLPICSSAYIMGIPIIHISGGDITEGAIDNGIRNAITMIASYHFPGTKDSASNIFRMRDSTKNIWAVGELGLDLFNREDLLSFDSIAQNLILDKNKKWILMTYHPETKQSLDYNLNVVRSCFQALRDLNDHQTVITYANADYGGAQINDYIERIAAEEPEKYIVVPSLGNLRYLSLMKYVSFIIGNSSSGIIEAPILGKHVINIGNRQKGRHLCSNIIQTDPDYPSIKKSVETAISTNVDMSDLQYWGDGHTSKRIISIMEKHL